MSQSPSWIQIAFSRPVVRRALFYAVVVGTVLNVINHSMCPMCVFHGCMNVKCTVQMFLTACVPYVVSTLSSVQAITAVQKKA